MDDINLIHYEERWGQTLKVVAEELLGDETQLSRFLLKVHNRTIKKLPVGNVVRRAFGLDKESRSLALSHVGKSFIVDTVLDHAGGVDAIVELGSGWGYNLFNAWARGGPSVPYFAHELTAAGANACASIAARFPQAGVRSLRYDFRTPTLDPIEGARHVLVFTAAAADKVEVLPDLFLEQILACAPRVTVLHFENVAWQLDNAPVDRQTEKAKRHKLNHNLVGMLQALEAEGRLRIDEIRPEVLGGVISVVRWSAGA